MKMTPTGWMASTDWWTVAEIDDGPVVVVVVLHVDASTNLASPAIIMCVCVCARLDVSSLCILAPTDIMHEVSITTTTTTTCRLCCPTVCPSDSFDV